MVQSRNSCPTVGQLPRGGWLWSPPVYAGATAGAASVAHIVSV